MAAAGCISWGPRDCPTGRAVVGTAAIAGWAGIHCCICLQCVVWGLSDAVRTCCQGLQQRLLHCSCCTATLEDASLPLSNTGVACNPSAELFQALLQRVDVLADSLAWRVRAICLSYNMSAFAPGMYEWRGLLVQPLDDLLSWRQETPHVHCAGGQCLMEPPSTQPRLSAVHLPSSNLGFPRLLVAEHRHHHVERGCDHAAPQPPPGRPPGRPLRSAVQQACGENQCGKPSVGWCVRCMVL